jgi:hypothetical protein
MQISLEKVNKSQNWSNITDLTPQIADRGDAAEGKQKRQNKG